MKRYNTREFLSYYNKMVLPKHKLSWKLSAYEIHSMFDTDEGMIEISRTITKSGHTEHWC